MSEGAWEVEKIRCSERFVRWKREKREGEKKKALIAARINPPKK